MNKYKEYIEYLIRKNTEYKNFCIKMLENAILPDVEYYDKELNKTLEVIYVLKEIIDNVEGE